MQSMVPAVRPVPTLPQRQEVVAVVAAFRRCQALRRLLRVHLQQPEQPQVQVVAGAEAEHPVAVVAGKPELHVVEPPEDLRPVAVADAVLLRPIPSRLSARLSTRARKGRPSIASIKS